jgi:hypothetical protein
MQLVMAVATVMLSPLSNLSSFYNQGLGWNQCVSTCCKEQSPFSFWDKGDHNAEA